MFISFYKGSRKWTDSCDSTFPQKVKANMQASVHNLHLQLRPLYTPPPPSVSDIIAKWWLINVDILQLYYTVIHVDMYIRLPMNLATAAYSTQLKTKLWTPYKVKTNKAKIHCPVGRYFMFCQYYLSVCVMKNNYCKLMIYRSYDIVSYRVTSYYNFLFYCFTGVLNTHRIVSTDRCLLCVIRSCSSKERYKNIAKLFL